MFELSKYITISDEQLSSELCTDNLMIVGKSGSGKTKLINRILRQLEMQSDYIYCFIDGCELINHTGEKSYGNINAQRITLNSLKDYPQQLLNTAISYDCYCSYSDSLDDDFISYLNRLTELCVMNNKKLVIVSDENTSDLNNMLIDSWQSHKHIISVINNSDIKVLANNFKIIQL